MQITDVQTQYDAGGQKHDRNAYGNEAWNREGRRVLRARGARHGAALPGRGGWDTGKVTDMSYMFTTCWELRDLDVSGWETGNVTNMSNMFEFCSSLRELDAAPWETGNVTSISQMFYSCQALESLYVSGWDTGKVENMSSLFYGCRNLTRLDVREWDTGNVKFMNYVFCDCESLERLVLSGWDTGNVTHMWKLLSGCDALSAVAFGGRFRFVSEKGQELLPSAVLDGHADWFSMADRAWNTADAIEKKRSGIRDVYTKYDKVLYLPEELTTVEPNAFTDTDAMIVCVPAGVTSIGEDAFPAYAVLVLKAENAAVREWAEDNGLDCFVL